MKRIIRLLIIKLKIFWFTGHGETWIRQVFSKMCDLDFRAFQTFDGYQIAAGGASVDIVCFNPMYHFAMNDTVNGDVTVHVHAGMQAVQVVWGLQYQTGKYLGRTEWIKHFVHMHDYFIKNGVYAEQQKKNLEDSQMGIM